MQNNQRKLISVGLPVYDMHGLGHIFLKHSLDILINQSFKDFDVIVSDYSADKVIKNLCQSYTGRLDIKYFKNTDPTGGMSANTNNAIRHATGKIIKILFQDDFLYDEKSLQIIAENFDLEKDNWLVTACEHSKDGKTFFRPFYPRYNHKILLGNNTISSPSVLSIKNDNPLLFDPKLKWLMDCDYYKRCYDKFGEPKIVNQIAAVNRIGDHQISKTEADEHLRKVEYKYVKEKNSIKNASKIRLPDVTLVAVSGINPTGVIKALEISMDGIEFNEVVLIAHNCPPDMNKKITFKKCKPNQLASQDPKNTNDFSHFMAYDLWEYINSDYALIVHNKAFVLRPDKWDEEFLKYDYIGPPWPKGVHFTNEGNNVRVGNGGFSLRSQKLMRTLNELKLPFTDNGTGFFHEDGIICVYYRKKLENYGIKFAPVDIASRFGREKDCEDSVSKPFGFHNNSKAMPRFFYLKRKLKNLGFNT
ncbi:MAG: DUF5672 family protein [Patescibacteria group bacterium]|jgi:hypothetical protein